MYKYVLQYTVDRFFSNACLILKHKKKIKKCDDNEKELYIYIFLLLFNYSPKKYTMRVKPSKKQYSVTQICK